MALVGLTMLPAGAELTAADAVDDVGAFRPSLSLLRPPPRLPKILFTTDASTSRATTTMAAPAVIPISRLRRRSPKIASSGLAAGGGRVGGEFVDGTEHLGAVGHRGRLLQQVQKR